MCYRYDEEELLEMLENNPKLLSNDLEARHLRRKLKVRKQLRSRNVPTFDFDEVVRKVALKNSNVTTVSGKDPLHELKSDQLNQQILDRFQVSTNFSTIKCKLFSKVIGSNLSRFNAMLYPTRNKFHRTCLCLLLTVINLINKTWTSLKPSSEYLCSLFALSLVLVLVWVWFLLKKFNFFLDF